jgi:hypothetical protein
VTREIVLFSGQLGTQRVRVWLQPEGGGVALNSHDIGPGLEPFFGEDEIETFLAIGPAQLPQLAGLLGCEPGVEEVLLALEDRYRGESSATTRLRAMLDEHGIAYDFHAI